MLTVAEYLTKDHQRMDQLLASLLNMAEAGAREIDRDIYLEFKASMLFHIRLEETVLLPSARDANGGKPLAIVSTLRLGHGAIVALLVPPPSLKILRALRVVLDAHNKLEEGPNGAYAECDLLLRSKVEEIVKQFEATPPVPMAQNLNVPRAMLSAANALERAGFSRSLIDD